MLRGENIVCGTTTTGTGTLTLAATPVAPGGIDFDVLARATGVGFANSAAVLVSYTIIEYSSTAFSTAVSQEKGIGTLTLGGSAGIANCTLARTTPQVTSTSLNSQPATYNTNGPTAVSVGTAANTLVFIGASAADIPAFSPYVDTLGDNLGAYAANSIASTSSSSTTSGVDVYMPFVWLVPMLVKRASVRVAGAYTGGTPVSNAYARIYDIATNGRPGKLLIDLGLMGTSNTSLNSVANISTALHGTGFFLSPGEYFFDFLPIYTGGVTAPTFTVNNAGANLFSGARGGSSMRPFESFTATGGAGGAAPDPANVTSWTGVGGPLSSPIFLLAAV